MRNVWLLLLFVLFSPVIAFCSQNGEPVGIFGDWVVFETFQDNKTLCYAMTIPQSSKANYENRGKPFFTVIKEKGSNNIELNVSVGYIISDNIGSVELQVKNDKYPFVNFQDRAWAYDVEDDRAIIEQFLGSAVFNIYSKSDNNKYSMDIYSLNGFSSSYRKINELCK